MEKWKRGTEKLISAVASDKDQTLHCTFVAQHEDAGEGSVILRAEIPEHQFKDVVTKGQPRFEVYEPQRELTRKTG